MDRREVNHRWWDEFDEKAMIIKVDFTGEGETEEIPAKYEVCGTCDGKGHHVNPSIDSHGLSAEDFDEDPDLMENYLGGLYDVPCAECRGKRVVPEPDTDRMTEEVAARVEKRIREFHEDQAERWYERRMGA